MIIIPKLHIDDFDWSRWRKGIAIWREIGVSCRYYSIIERRDTLRNFAIGFLPGKSLICRPKFDEFAIMFLIDEEFCWTHFTKEEFKIVFTK